MIFTISPSVFLSYSSYTPSAFLGITINNNKEKKKILLLLCLKAKKCLPGLHISEPCMHLFNLYGTWTSSPFQTHSQKVWSTSQLTCRAAECVLWGVDVVILWAFGLFCYPLHPFLWRYAEMLHVSLQNCNSCLSLVSSVKAITFNRNKL